MPTTLPVAILWQSDASDVGFAVEAGTIPSSSNTGVFTLDINALPPAPAVESLHGQALPGVDPSLQWTAGTLVAYLDNNHNGTLDLSDVVALDDKHDRIIGAAPVYTLFDVVGGKPAPAQYVGIVPVSAGFSIVEEPGRADPPLGSCDKFDSHGHFSKPCRQGLVGVAQTILPATAIPLEVNADPNLQRFDCTKFLGPFDFADWEFAPSDQICGNASCKFCQGYDCPIDLPPPDVDSLTCSADGLEYSYKKCSNDPTQCDTRFCHYGHGARQAGDPIPAGWPCP